MIPRYRPPFGLLPILSGLLGARANISVENIEDAYANHYCVPYALLLPSCRVGIRWALETCSSSPMSVACSAFTCTTVLESILRSGSRLVGVDLATDSFLMEPLFLNSLKYQSLVLCEIYGYTYDLSTYNLHSKSGAGVRIIDMAMTVPMPNHLRRLNSTDFAVTSFGVGKCLYAGWGGIGFTHDRKMAMEIRRVRDKYIEHESLGLFIKRSVEIMCRSIVRQPALYGLYRGIADLTQSLSAERSGSNSSDPLDYVKQPLSVEWYMPTTVIDRYLMLCNLDSTKEYAEKRIALAERYDQNLRNIRGLLLPPISKDALSHYTIRVHPLTRDVLKKSLYDMGVETSTLFFLSRIFNAQDFPNADKVASQVINLPIDVRMGLPVVDWICECLLKALRIAHDRFPVLFK